jgi:DNA-binding NarL/FixJ family response regulator
VVARAADGTEALSKITAMQPTVAIVDLEMPKLTGLEIARQAAAAVPATSIVLYTGNSDRALLAEAVDAGARGFVSKAAPLPDLLRAIHTVINGQTYVDPVVAGNLASARAMGRLVDLTERERAVLRALADGRNYDEIGREMFISPETVRTHVQKAMRRLDANTRTQAVAMALRQSLIA